MVNGELRVLLGVGLGVKQGLLGEDVDVEVVAALLDVAVDHADEVVNLLGSNGSAHVSSFLVWVAPGRGDPLFLSQCTR